jgi:MFS family permease
VFMLIGAMAAASLMSVLMVPAAAIDHARARGLRDGDEANAGKPSGYRVLLTCRPLLIFVLCAVLFHFANVAMLPLVGQKLALQDSKLGTSLMSACIVAAQIVMVPMAILVGRRADVWGRKPLFIAGFVILPIRGVLYTLSDKPYWLVGVQLLDGVGAGLYGALFPKPGLRFRPVTSRWRTNRWIFGSSPTNGKATLSPPWSNILAGRLTCCIAWSGTAINCRQAESASV